MKKVHDDFIIINLYIESANFTPGAHGSKQSITDYYIEFDISKSPLKFIHFEKATKFLPYF